MRIYGREGRSAGSGQVARKQSGWETGNRPRVAEKPETRPRGCGPETAAGLTGRGRAGNVRGAVNRARGPGRQVSGPTSGRMKSQAAGPVLPSTGLRWATRPGGLERPGRLSPRLIACLFFQVGQSGCQRFWENSPGRRPACRALGTERSRRPSEPSGSAGRRGHRRDVVARDTGPSAHLSDAGPLHWTRR